MKQKTLEEMAARHPQMIVFQDTYDSIRSARIIGFKIDGDGRNRVGLRAFATKTGRNAPSGKEKKKKKQKKREDRGFIFSLAKWVRFLIAPKPDHALLYIDLEQAEFGIAAALSGDPAMMGAYRSADFYFTFARQAGEDVPAGATVEGLKEQFNGGEISRETYERLINLRKLYKIVVLATQYGLGISVEEAQNLLDVHRRTYRVFWDWIEDQLDLARLNRKMMTCFGWHLRVNRETETRTLMNFPMQAGCGEIFRLWACLVSEAGYETCAPAHDALLVQVPVDQAGIAASEIRALAAEASRAVLPDVFELRTDVQIIAEAKHCKPGWSKDRFYDKDGAGTWALILEQLEYGEKKRVAAE